MTKAWKAIAGSIIFLFTVVVVALALTTGPVPSSAKEVDGKLERVIRAAESEDLNVTATTLSDAYGPQFVLGAVLCEGQNTDDFAGALQLPNRPEELPDVVEPGTNYMVLFDNQFHAVVDGIPTSSLNLCADKRVSQAPIQGSSLIPFVKTDTGEWVLAGVM